ncbi:type IX secretion system ring subunit PorN/GldN [Neolewinella antarctica]|uniref:Gliding motility associated protein GldN n=1 Tax=Neolewinella antarctica TaxID=442734 RepID=A0ABX0XGU5_9BACT|nr:gliding motility protein GldN [Neolewinella antarctica]NJC28101.1 gliding motility associated protein GldN [Neolewinella antarctica]
MKAVFQLALLLTFGASTALMAQRPANPTINNSSIELPGSGDPTGAEDPANNQFINPVNDIVERKMVAERSVLPYEHVREADIMWQKRIWRVLDVREKINLPFANPERPLISIMMDAAAEKKIQLYSVIDDKFSTVLPAEDLAALGGGIDTVEQYDEDFNVTYVEVATEFNPDVVKRYRLQEVWFFDKESSTMQVRILGIAPLMDQYDENGNFLYERAMFWVYYPGARQVLANESAFVFGNDAANRSWEDVFESRYFNSYVTQESNVLDRRIESYMPGGRDRLMEAERIKQEIFNFEQDLWSY